mmetsp:Transcript_712/g.1490  ORF Transcript_712/g.1490 Transcript_712/m.1490 type:complete len:112 (+) Transcript_712:60-395(+)
MSRWWLRSEESAEFQQQHLPERPCGAEGAGRWAFLEKAAWFPASLAQIPQWAPEVPAAGASEAWLDGASYTTMTRTRRRTRPWAAWGLNDYGHPMAPSLRPTAAAPKARHS